MEEKPKHLFLLGDLPRRFERWRDNGVHHVNVYVKPGEHQKYQRFHGTGASSEEFVSDGASIESSLC